MGMGADKLKYEDLDDEEVVREIRARMEAVKRLLTEIRDLLRAVGE